MSKDEFVDFVYTMHLQNTNGRESHNEMFKLGIGAAYDEMKELLIAFQSWQFDKGYLYQKNLQDGMIEEFLKSNL